MWYLATLALSVGHAWWLLPSLTLTGAVIYPAIVTPVVLLARVVWAFDVPRAIFLGTALLVLAAHVPLT